MKIREQIYFRYEPEIGDGTLYIYDIKLDAVYRSSAFIFDVLTTIDSGAQSVQDIEEKLGLNYSEISNAEFSDSISTAVNSLIKLSVVSN